MLLLPHTGVAQMLQYYSANSMDGGAGSNGAGTSQREQVCMHMHMHVCCVLEQNNEC